MQLSIFALPLLGGYLFCRTCEWYKYSLDRRTGYDLFFMSAIAGLILWIPCAILIGGLTATIGLAVFAVNQLGAGIGNYFNAGPAFGIANGLICVAACALGRPLGLALNRGWVRTQKVIDSRGILCAYRCLNELLLLSRHLTSYPLIWPIHRGIEADYEVDKQIEENGDEIEKLFRGAYAADKMVMVTLNSGKLFVCFATSNADPYGDRKYFRLLKISSGYRTEDKNVVIVTRYEEILDEIGRAYEGDDWHPSMASDFHVIVPKNRIAYANIFDPDIKERFDSPPK